MAKKRDLPASEHETLLWELVEELQASNESVHEGTIMSSRCVRVSGEFLAMPHHKTDGLVVKLPRDRVTELIDAGVGDSFAPAGKVFSEWVAIYDPDEDLWRQLLHEGVEFVTPRAK